MMLFKVSGLKDFCIVNRLKCGNVFLSAVNSRYKCVRPPPITAH